MRVLEELSGWRGSREELVNVLQTLEDANPKTFPFFPKPTVNVSRSEKRGSSG